MPNESDELCIEIFGSLPETDRRPPRMPSDALVTALEHWSAIIAHESGATVVAIASRLRAGPISDDWISDDWILPIPDEKRRSINSVRIETQDGREIVSAQTVVDLNRRCSAWIDALRSNN